MNSELCQWIILVSWTRCHGQHFLGERGVAHRTWSLFGTFIQRFTGCNFIRDFLESCAKMRFVDLLLYVNIQRTTAIASPRSGRSQIRIRTARAAASPPLCPPARHPRVVQMDTTTVRIPPWHPRGHKHSRCR